MFIQLDIKSPLYPFKKWVPVFYLQPFYLGCRVLIEAAEVESRKLSRLCGNWRRGTILYRYQGNSKVPLQLQHV